MTASLYFRRFLEPGQVLFFNSLGAVLPCGNTVGEIMGARPCGLWNNKGVIIENTDSFKYMHRITINIRGCFRILLN